MLRQLAIAAAATVMLGTSSARAAKYDELRIPCGAGELTTLQTAVANATKLAKAASSSLPPVNSTSGARFRRWFGGADGDYDPTPKTIYDGMVVTLVFQKFWCLPPNSNTPDVLFHTNAFILKGAVGEIFVTSNFFALPPTGAKSQGGTILHEASHQSQVRRTTDDDKLYGPAAAATRAATSATRARNTADNYKYYAEDVLYGVP